MGAHGNSGFPSRYLIQNLYLLVSGWMYAAKQIMAEFSRYFIIVTSKSSPTLIAGPGAEGRFGAHPREGNLSRG